MKIEEINEKKIWEDFLLGCDEKTFLDSWNWGEFNKMMGDKIWRFGIYTGEQLTAVALVIKIEARRGTFLFVPHGPVIKADRDPTSVNSTEVRSLNLLLEELKKLAKRENCSFIRISPIWKRTKESIKIFKDLGFREAPIHMHPELTWELNLEPSEEELLMNMRKTTRYLIRQGLKNKGIEIIQSCELKDVEKFNKLYQETVNRHHFTPFSLRYLKNEFSAFEKDNQPIQQVQGCPECTEGQISIFLGKYSSPHSGGKDEIIASAMIIFWQNIAFYHQGASSHKYPKIPVSYLLQWEAIKEAKKRGCKIYNFWGIAPESAPKKLHSVLPRRGPLGRHPWHGLTLFKMGFGGYKKEYVKTQDFVLSQKYWLNYVVEKVRKHRRGL